MEPGLRIGGRYRLRRPLGSGGFGEVWQADDLLRDRPVAIKLLNRTIMASQAIAFWKFRQEARIVVRLEHPGITQVEDFGEYDGHWYLVMEFLEGRDLAAELADHARGLPLARVMALAVQIADALVAAHEMGVVHRDLKPANLMVLPGDRLKICDFGIAHVAGASTEQTFTGIVGTPMYMAPEQWLGRKVDHRTDLYALGGILYTLLTGHPPFAGGRTEELMGRHLHLAPPRVRKARPDVSAGLDRLIGELLAKKPARRPARTADVLARLRSNEQARLSPRRTSSPPEPTALPGMSRRMLLSGGAVVASAASVSFLVSRMRDAGTSASTPRPATGAKPATARFHLRSTFQGQGDSIMSRAFRPDGAILVVTTNGALAKVWNATTNALVTTLVGHDDDIRSAAFGPDGTVVATTGADGSAMVWNATTGALITPLKGHKDDVHVAAFSPDGSMVATAGDDRTARVWNPGTGKLIATLADHRAFFSWSLEFNPDSSVLATTNSDQTAKLWNPRTGHVIATLSGHKIEVASAVFNLDGSLLVTASSDHTAKVWNTRTGGLTTTLKGHKGFVYAAVFSPDGSMVATASVDRTAKVWNPRTGDLAVTLTGHRGQLFSAVFNADGSVLVTESADRTAKVWQE
ncbi:WD40 repeat domain-containing serine/threonine protein kinase [Nonomuraea sp. LPB2021202275-12-8]|uniref:WD40 repeat domain-containing serine/threonine protein kinase n=1 Tax=Nonomuraea sp. LPB2021202275-12-8 TaxID=3120159 RepID=UPI00300D66D3